ncbi:Golgi complex component 7-domain-containing protein [Rhodotorula toruloides]
MPAGLTPPRSLSPSALSPTSDPSPSPTISDDLDLAVLTSDAFTSEADWLNAVVEKSLTKRKSGDQSLAEVESTLTRTLHSLDISVGDTSAAVDRLITEISLSVPRLTFDLQLMRENALLLRFTLDGIRKRGGGYGTESEVGKVLERMRVLDLVKQRMEAARDVLREAESWSTLESEVTGLIGEDQYAKAAERLAEAARSMVVFQNTAEYEGRRALMVSLQNQLEASLSSGLVKAINERDVKGCKQLWNIFGMIQREQEYRTYYFSNRRGTLVDSWTSAKLSDCLEAPSALPISATPNLNAPTQKFVDALAHFYSDLQVLLAEERTYIPAIFPDPAPTLSSFIETTLEGLSPPIPQRLTSIADFYGPLVLPELIAAYKATEEFAVQVERTFIKLEPSPAPAPSPPAHSPTSLSKRLSARSISFATGQGPDFLSDHGGDEDEEASAAQVRPWETALFEPFLDWQVEYPELERRYVASEMSKSLGDIGDWTAGLTSGSSSAGSEKGAKILLDKAGKVFSVLEEAIGRNLALTHGYGARGLVDVMNEQLVAFFDRRKEDLMRAGREKGSASARRRAQATAAALAGGIASPDEEQEMVLEGLEYSTEDWSTFQFGLKLLDTCRGMAERLTAFEAKLKARMTVLAHAVREARESPARYTVPGTTKGAILLLRQSTLNSAELAELLDPLEKPHEAPSGGSLSHPPPPPPPSPFLLPKARGAATDFTRTTQLFLHDTILAPLFAHLNEYSTLACWTTTQEQRPGGKGAFDLAIPTFSLSPTETISRVGEGLFNLPRLFEVYADDDALAFSIETLPFVDVETLRALQQPPQAAPPMLRIPASPALTRTRRGSLVAGSPSSHASASQPAHMPLSAETVIATWLSSLTLSILSHLTSTVLPDIPRLSKHGSAQLVSDLEYLANVARALDVESPEELDSWRDAAALDDKALRGEAEVDERIDRTVLERVARIRGIRRAA